METDIPYDVLAGIVRQQLSDNASWHITSYSTNGTGAKKVPYSMSTTAYVMIPDEKTVEHVFHCVCEAAGKTAFGERTSIEGIRKWMGTPEAVKDGRVMGGYLEMFFRQWD